MHLNKVQNQPNFGGGFQGLAIRKNGVLSLPRTPMDGCRYSDKLMMRIVKKTLDSEKYHSNLSIVLGEQNKDKTLIFELEPSIIKKFIPWYIKLFGGRMFNLPNPKFWGILDNKKMSKIRYLLPQQDFKKTIQYFNEPITPTEQITNHREDPSIIKKAHRFETSLRKSLSKPEDQKWLDEFFQEAKQK